MKVLWEEYKDWIIRKVHLDTDDEYGNSYYILCDYLHNRDFVPILEKDINRVEDGLELRNTFLSIKNEKVFNFDCNCKIFEMLVMLAIRMDSEFIGEPGIDNTHKIFWNFLYNLDLISYTDKYWSEQDVDWILSQWMNREYSINGDGGIFPLKYTNRNQRNIDLWGQMLEYISENY